MYRGRIKSIHFVGIGGSGMNGIAEVLVNMGYKVTGSDMAEGPVTRRLAGLGVRISLGHSAENVHGANCVVYSSAVSMSNPELTEAASMQIPVIPRAEMLAELMRMKFGIAIAGTHGKTTTTSMISAILAATDIDPTVVTGGKVNNLGANARLGSGDVLVAEADESDGSFLKLSPTIAVVTSIDREHMEHYSEMEEVTRAYLDFMNKVPFYGCAVICLDHPVIQGLIPHILRRFLSYGITAQADVHAANITYDRMSTTFELWYGSSMQGSVTLNMPGEYNVYNALGAICVARELGVGFEAICEGFRGFTGVERRFDVIGREAGVMVVDDYGHHPEEVKAVLKAAKVGWGKPLVVVFQPHRFTRTRDLFDEFLSSFNDADKLILTDIYPAGEEPIKGIDGVALFNGIKGHGHKDVEYMADFAAVAPYLDSFVKAGEMVITLGAGDVRKIGEELLGILKKRKVLKIK
jgi:UDP-N-acetylmuramate--alanine ligase